MVNGPWNISILFLWTNLVDSAISVYTINPSSFICFFFLLLHQIVLKQRLNPADFYFLHSHFYFISFFFFFIIFISSRADFYLKIFEGNSKNVWHKTNKNHSFSSRNIFCSSLRNVHQIFECSVITLLKRMKYENRLVFAYYNILRF